MKQLILISGLLLNFTVSAKTSFVIKPNELQVNCSKDEALVTMDKLRLYTKSNMRAVSAYVSHEGMCRALADYLINQTSLMVELETRLSEEKAVVRDLPCDGNICKTVYRAYLAEYVSVWVKEVQFSGKAIVPGTERFETIEWDSRYCPPYAPDCDL